MSATPLIQQFPELYQGCRGEWRLGQSGTVLAQLRHLTGRAAYRACPQLAHSRSSTEKEKETLLSSFSEI